MLKYIDIGLYTLQLYTIDGQPVLKQKKSRIHKHNQILIVQNNWKCIIYDKWIIGIVLQNTSSE